MNKIIEENKLMDRLKLLRQQEKEVSNSGEMSNIDDNTKRRIYSSGIQIHSNANELETAEEKEIQKSSLEKNIEFYNEEEMDESIRITQNQQLAALSILSGNVLIQNIELVIEIDPLIRSQNKFVDVSLGLEYEEKTFLQCIEMKKNLKQRIGLLKLEIAKLNTLAQKLKNKGNKSKEYRNVLDSIEKNNEALHNQNIELLKVEKRIKQLSIEENFDGYEGITDMTKTTNTDSDRKTTANIDINEEEYTETKKKRRMIIRDAILKEAKRRIEEEKKKILCKKELENKTFKDRECQNEDLTKIVKKDEQKNEVFVRKNVELKELTAEKLQEITDVAKMLVWLQENSHKNPATVKTRKVRGKIAIENFKKLHLDNKEQYEKISEKIKKKFEHLVYEKEKSRIEKKQS